MTRDELIESLSVFVNDHWGYYTDYQIDALTKHLEATIPGLSGLLEGTHVVVPRNDCVAVVASLAAAISTLEKTKEARKAVASDRMFNIMLDDYRKALRAGRAMIAAQEASHDR